MNAKDSFHKTCPEHLPDTNTVKIYYEPVHKPYLTTGTQTVNLFDLFGT